MKIAIIYENAEIWVQLDKEAFESRLVQYVEVEKMSVHYALARIVEELKEVTRRT